MRRIVILLLLATGLICCNKQDIENTYISQESSIESYINSLSDSYRVVRNKGSNRVVITEGSGDSELEAGDSLYFYYSGYIFSNGKGKLFATNDTTVANANDFITDGLVKGIKFGKDPLISGLQNGLEGVKTGESCYIIFSGKYGFGNEIMATVPALSPLFYDIYVERIVKQ